jgi:hypothetical protein
MGKKEVASEALQELHRFTGLTSLSLFSPLDHES